MGIFELPLNGFLYALYGYVLSFLLRTSDNEEGKKIIQPILEHISLRKRSRLEKTVTRRSVEF